jgi:hypothetical protein
MYSVLITKPDGSTFGYFARDAAHAEAWLKDYVGNLGPAKKPTKPRKPRRLKAKVSRQGSKWLLKMGKGDALFSTKREATELAEMLNEMPYAEAKEAMGI